MASWSGVVRGVVLAEQDQEFAARYNELKANVEDSQIGHLTQLGVTTPPAVGASK
ncbi:hypothetical protein [Nocardia sp. NPDC049707]|uniref:hypothetical protein n=1 Tax=Nocardia sp. NPDC049707 TaxID=3154735 RepID=UPI00342AF73A